MNSVVFINGRIYSPCMDLKNVNLSKIGSAKQAMVVENGKVIFIGDEEKAKALSKRNVTIVDLKGRCVLPGLANCHGHMSLHADSLYSADLYSVLRLPGENLFDVTEKYLYILKKFAEKNKRNCLRGIGWSAAIYREDETGRFPTKEDLDRACIDRPLVVQSACGHYLWANSEALRVARITKNTPDPSDGVIFRDEEGEPTGIFMEFSAIGLITKHIVGYDYSVEEYKKAILSCCYEKYLPLGFTLFFDAMPTENACQAYRALAEEDKLPMRIRAAYYTERKDFEAYNSIIKSYKKKEYDIDDIFQMNTVKFFNDGVGKAVLMEREYGIISGYYGWTVWRTENLEKRFEEILNTGLNIHVHCIGDGTVRETVTAFSMAQKRAGIMNGRNAIIHLSSANQRDVKRMNDLHLIAIVQPYWMCGQYHEENLYGKGFLDVAYPLQSFFREGVITAGSDDYPVSGAVNPFEAIQIGITRQVSKKIMKELHLDYRYEERPVYGTPANYARERTSLENMFLAYTINGAYACFLEEKTGSLEVGKSADFIVINKDIFDIPVSELENVKVLQTYFKGNCVYNAE